MSVVVMNEKVMKVKNVKLGVKYERIYMCLYTVLNRFCVSSEDDVSSVEEGGFVLKKSEMRKILESVEFYNEDVVVQGEYMEANLLSKENMKKVRKSMKQERICMKKGVLEVVKKVRKSKKAKVLDVSQEEISFGETVNIPVVIEKKIKKSKKSKKSEKGNVEEVDIEKIEIDVGKVVVVVEEVGGVVEEVGGVGVVEEVGGGGVVEEVGGVERDLVKEIGGDVEDVVGGDIWIMSEKEVIGEGGKKGAKKDGKKTVKKPKKKTEMVEDIAHI